MANNYLYIVKYGNKRGNVFQLNIQSSKGLQKKYHVIFPSKKFHRMANVFSIIRETLCSLTYTDIIFY